jgi:diguanylate cyclase (GGDEF)-like protein
MGVLLLPFSFYYSYNATQNTLADTSIIRQVSQNGGEMLLLAQTADSKKRNQIISKIDKNLTEISPWFSKNNNQEFYIGKHTLKKDYENLISCWTKLKNDPRQEASSKCWYAVKSLSFTIDKMLLLKQNKLKNIFYINIILSTIFLLMLIMMVRAYIHHQLKKHAIYDYDTKLFNKKYFWAEFKTSCARAVRYKNPLSFLSISINNFEIYDKKTKENILREFGKLFISMTRTSDTACRCDENHFLAILPGTEENNALILEKRMSEVFNTHDFNGDPRPTFNFSTTQFKPEETVDDCMVRVEELLHES